MSATCPTPFQIDLANNPRLPGGTMFDLSTVKARDYFIMNADRYRKLAVYAYSCYSIGGRGAILINFEVNPPSIYYMPQAAIERNNFDALSESLREYNPSTDLVCILFFR